jgi:chemotaxis response regulator CheB
VLYSLIFVTQPLNAISPIDQKFFELIVPIATFLTGTLSGIMLSGGDKDAQKEALKAANAGWTRPPAPAPSSPSPSPVGGMPRPAMGMGMAPAVSPLANATTMPVYEAGDPTFRNSRND